MRNLIFFFFWEFLFKCFLIENNNSFFIYLKKMILKIISHKIRLYKRFQTDIWGFILYDIQKNKKINNLFSKLLIKKNLKWRKKGRFVYDLESSEEEELYNFLKIRKQKMIFLKRKISKLFYLTLSFKQFRFLSKRAAKMDGIKEGNFVMLVENRLISIMYRMQFLLNVFEIRQFILNKNVLVDNNSTKNYNLFINFFQIVSIKNYYVRKIKYNIIKRLSNKINFFFLPNYLYVNYKFLFGFVFIEPKLKNLFYPNIFVDIYRVADIK